MRWWVVGVAMTAASQAVEAQTPFERAVDAVEARMTAIDKMENVIPGRAIVAVRAGQDPYIDVRGLNRVESGQPADANTPFYIASMTKAFVGLMAIRLDDTGVLPLDTPLAEVFPDMIVKDVDLNTLSMRRLLSHQLGFTAQALNFRNAYTDTVDPDDYPRIVALTQGPAEASFQYSNLGYLLYAAALEKKTKRPWKQWLDEQVFEPLGMTSSSARSSKLSNVTWGHERVGDAWRSLPPKPDALMHAAGGIYVSAADMARFLDAQVGGSTPIPATTIARAQGTSVAMELNDGPMKCTGYSLGWIRCAAFGESILTHSGEYAGQRSVMLVVPSRQIGFAAMFNSDSMTGGLGQQLALTFLAALAGQAENIPDAAAFAERYREIAERYRENRTQEEQEARSQPEWGGWQWRPNAAELAAYAGRYGHPAFGEIIVKQDGLRLEASLNGTPLDLQPAVRDRFGASLTSFSRLMPFVFERDGSGRLVAVTTRDTRFERQP